MPTAVTNPMGDVGDTDDDSAAAAAEQQQPNKGEKVGGDVMSGLASPTSANLCMGALTPQQIHDRLAARWTVQVTPRTLAAAINLSLAFGSEYIGLSGQPELWRSIYMTVSAAAFVFNMNAAGLFVQQVADVARVPDHRMKESLGLGFYWSFLGDFVSAFGDILTMAQVGMAFWAMTHDLLVIAGLVLPMLIMIPLGVKRSALVTEFGVYEYEAPSPD